MHTVSYRSYLSVISVIKEHKFWFNQNLIVFTHRNHQHLRVDDLIFASVWVGWVGRGYIEIRRYFPALWINRVTLVTKIKLWYSLGY